ncbi:hypothetical protein A5714_02660 [Mycobacterium sp. E2462]|uniref:hypothetical protein n=1 Tax=Mycobacterium sp. E2462 TaxID=1834133 RepID=UPI0007FFED5D|nr:hypothetical protein [Mycobacterium sp. E2462]OBI04805.1 hypothetical protein A5714_02660 [Mycobacterium sp. E2462]
MPSVSPTSSFDRNPEEAAESYVSVFPKVSPDRFKEPIGELTARRRAGGGMRTIVVADLVPALPERPRNTLPDKRSRALGAGVGAPRDRTG